MKQKTDELSIMKRVWALLSLLPKPSERQRVARWALERAVEDDTIVLSPDDHPDQKALLLGPVMAHRRENDED